MTNDDTAPDTAKLLVHGYVDGELDPANALSIQERIAADPALAAEHDRTQALRAALREKLPPRILPPHVRARVATAVGLHRPRIRPSWQALAASVALALMVASASTWLIVAPASNDRVAEAVVDGHLRALMAAQPFEVASSDRHTVKPWFSGRLPQAPRVIDLSAEGFALAGGRIDVIGRTLVPTLAYRYRQHLISLSAVPVATGDRAAARRAINGYNLVGWTENGTAYWAVSDLGAGDLDSFARAFRNATPD